MTTDASVPHTELTEPSGPLEGLRVVELGGMGPGPFAAMLLADLGADVVRVDRVGGGQHELDTAESRRTDVLARGRRSIAVDLKQEEGREIVLRLIDRADASIEGFRPGVAERLGVGPDVCFNRNPALVYGRMTGWGQEGPYAAKAGHDLNYIALAGVLSSIGRPGAGPTPPLNLVGDFGGGAMFLAFGIMAALHERSRSGLGQVVDAAMVDGAITLNASSYMLRAQHEPVDRGQHFLSGAAPHYDAYECADGNWITIASLESRFYDELRTLLGLDGELWVDQADRTKWAERKAHLAQLFGARTRTEWCHVFEGRDACFAPVLDLVEAAAHPHNAARRNIVTHNDVLQPAPAPRFSRTPGGLGLAPPAPGQHTAQIMGEIGLADQSARLGEAGIVGGLES